LAKKAPIRPIEPVEVTRAIVDARSYVDMAKGHNFPDEFVLDMAKCLKRCADLLAARTDASRSLLALCGLPLVGRPRTFGGAVTYLPAKTQYEEDFASMGLHRAFEVPHGPGETCHRCPQPLTLMTLHGFGQIDFKTGALGRSEEP